MNIFFLIILNNTTLRSHLTSPTSFSTLPICGFWSTAARKWKGSFNAKMRIQAAGVGSLSPWGICLFLHPYARARGACRGREMMQKPALSVRPSHVNTKSQIVLWHVLGCVSDKHVWMSLGAVRALFLCAHGTHEQTDIYTWIKNGTLHRFHTTNHFIYCHSKSVEKAAVNDDTFKGLLLVKTITAAVVSVRMCVRGLILPYLTGLIWVLGCD